MSQAVQLSERLSEVLLDGKWIANTNFKEQIENITWKEATHKVSALNTVALLTYHINYYIGGILDGLERGVLEISDKYSFDMPTIDSEAKWQLLVNEFITNSEKFVECIAEMDGIQIDGPFIDEKYGTFRRNIEGVIEHSYYHLGQVVIISKMVKNNE